MSKIDTEIGVIKFNIENFNDRLKVLCKKNKIDYNTFLKDLNKISPCALEESLATMIFCDYMRWRPRFF